MRSVVEFPSYYGARNTPARIVSGRPIVVDPCEPDVAIRFATHGAIPDAAPEDYRLHIVRVGDPGEWVDYAGFDQDANHDVVFRLDDAFFSKPPGRYHGEIIAGGCCHVIQFEIPACASIVGAGRADRTVATECEDE